VSLVRVNTGLQGATEGHSWLAIFQIAVEVYQSTGKRSIFQPVRAALTNAQRAGSGF
jgi:hypothetical protein